MDDTGEREGLEQLAERVIGPRGTGRERVLPSADLCTIALRVAEALEVYERDGGTAHRDDVLRNEEFQGVVVLAKCKTALPRPQGRWEVAVSDGTDDEWVIGEAGGSWRVEGLERLTGGTLPDQRVGVDACGSSAPPPVVGRGRRARQAPAGWHPDPEARHDLRLFDGTAWTRFVVDVESTAG